MQAGSSAPRSRPRCRLGEARPVWGPRLRAIDAPSASLARSLALLDGVSAVRVRRGSGSGWGADWQLCVVRTGARQLVMYGSLGSARLASASLLSVHLVLRENFARVRVGAAPTEAVRERKEG